MQPNEILDFWFSPLVRRLWFDSTPEFDQELKMRFEFMVQAAARGELDTWQRTPEGALALVLLLDQLPLNIYRGQAQSFHLGDQALAVAKAAIAQGFDRTLPHEQLSFLYMPFMHSESLPDQDKSVELFERAGLSANINFARHHRELVRKFGRFPHRNASLGRKSTPEEEAYLHSKGAFLG